MEVWKNELKGSVNAEDGAGCFQVKFFVVLLMCLDCFVFQYITLYPYQAAVVCVFVRKAETVKGQVM